MRRHCYASVAVLVIALCLWIGAREAEASRAKDPLHKKVVTPDLMKMLDKSAKATEVKALVRKKMEKAREKAGLYQKGEQMTEDEMIAAAGTTSRRIHHDHNHKKAWQDVPRPGDRNYETPLKFQSDTLAERLASPEEEAVSRIIFGYISQTRFPDDKITYSDVHPVLKAMGMNVSISAADVYNGFDGVDWVDLYEERIICDLDLSLKKPLLEGGIVFDTPKYCVKDVVSMQVRGKSMDSLKEAIRAGYNDYITDPTYEIIGGTLHRILTRRRI